MTTYTLAQAKNQLSKLVEEVLQGGQVMITRHGKAAVRLVAVQPGPRAVTDRDLDQLATLRASLPPLQEPAVATLQRMRDDGDPV